MLGFFLYKSLIIDIGMVRVKMTAILMPSKLDFTFIKPIYNISWYLLVNVVSLILMFFIFFC